MSLSSEIGYLINIFEYLMKEIGNGRQLWQAMHLIGSCPISCSCVDQNNKADEGGCSQAFRLESLVFGH